MDLLTWVRGYAERRNREAALIARVISPRTQAVIDEIERGRARSDAQRAKENARMEIIADLLRGDVLVMGRPVKLVFTNGLWGTMTEADVLKSIEKALGREDA